MFENLTKRFTLIGIAFVAQAEMWAVGQLEEFGKIISGSEKKAQAKAWLKAEYRNFERPIPILNATEIDDVLIDQAADAAIDKAFELAGDAVNAARKLFPVSTTTAPELPVGGLE